MLFAVHDWRLGHATRDLLLIRGLLGGGHLVRVVSNGRALALPGPPGHHDTAVSVQRFLRVVTGPAAEGPGGPPPGATSG